MLSKHETNPRQNRPGERGTALLLALLVLVSLAGVGLIVVRHVMYELQNSGNYQVMKQGYYIGEAGLAGPLVQAARNQSGFISVLESKQFRVYSTDIANGFFDTSSLGSLGLRNRTADSAGFVTYFTNPVDTKRIPGFSTGGFCYRKYTVTADGFLETEDVNPDDPETLTHTAQPRFISHVYLGPFPCGM